MCKTTVCKILSDIAKVLGGSVKLVRLVYYIIISLYYPVFLNLY